MLNDIDHESRIGRIVEFALLEDVGVGDITSEALVPVGQHGTAEILCKEDGIVAGIEVAGLVFKYSGEGIQFSPLLSDGVFSERDRAIARLKGPTSGILRGERTALNFLQRMSGIATLTRKYVDEVKGTHARILDTRKTAPGLRMLDKWAVRLGGGDNHRFGLDDMILIKENHILAAGGIVNAIQQCVRFIEEKHLNVPIEVETRTLEEVRTVLAGPPVQRIMLDNFALQDMHRAVDLINHKIQVEASGGISLLNVRSVAETGVDMISVGALTHSVKALDLALNLCSNS
jgi:nicotinate-nucleotide pyrophosphorylase (carboxylating)